MDKEQAIHSFWSSFGIPAYDANTVPDDAVMPYITYSVATGALEDVLLLNASIWYRSTSWRDVAEKTKQIAEYVGVGGYKLMRVDGGYLFLTQGSPFSQRMPDQSDDMIRRVYININAEFFTAY